jgi:hypothetical protein
LAGACRLSAADAEFGVCVTGGRVDMHVFSGEVQATNALLLDQETGEPDDDPEATGAVPASVFTKAIIEQGRALVVNNQNSVLKVSHWAKAAPSMFATKLTMAGQLPVSAEYCEAVLKSRPYGYWRFESGKNRIVASEVPGAPELNVVGDLRLSGLSGNRVAEFCPGSDCYLVSREHLDSLARSDYSAEVWVKPSHVHGGAIVGLCATDPASTREMNALLVELLSSGSQQVRSNFSLDHPCSVRFLHRDPPARSVRAGTSCFSRRPYSVRRWQHIVALKRGSQMELYIDGKLAATGIDKSSLATGLHLVVGRQESIGSTFQFIGQLDELALYPRALDKAEIESHYKAINWTEANRPVTDPKDS